MLSSASAGNRIWMPAAPRRWKPSPRADRLPCLASGFVHEDSFVELLGSFRQLSSAGLAEKSHSRPGHRGSRGGRRRIGQSRGDRAGNLANPRRLSRSCQRHRSDSADTDLGGLRGSWFSFRNRRGWPPSGPWRRTLYLLGPHRR